MSDDRRIGLAGLVVTLAGIAVFYIWPNQKKENGEVFRRRSSVVILGAEGNEDGRRLR